MKKTIKFNDEDGSCLYIDSFNKLNKLEVTMTDDNIWEWPSLELNIEDVKKIIAHLTECLNSINESVS